MDSSAREIAFQILAVLDRIRISQDTIKDLAFSAIYLGIASLTLSIFVSLIVYALYERGLRRRKNQEFLGEWLSKLTSDDQNGLWLRTSRIFGNFFLKQRPARAISRFADAFSRDAQGTEAQLGSTLGLGYPQLCGQVSAALQRQGIDTRGGIRELLAGFETEAVVSADTDPSGEQRRSAERQMIIAEHRVDQLQVFMANKWASYHYIRSLYSSALVVFIILLTSPLTDKISSIAIGVFMAFSATIISPIFINLLEAKISTR